MPHLVKMQKKYAKDGVVILSVHVGSLEETNLKEQVAKKLNSKRARFDSVVLNDETWQDRFRVITYPFVYVFNRQGKWTQFKGEEARYKKPQDMLDNMEKLVATLAASK